ncbi:MAG: alpha-hydroxy-acid oxidizing protein [Rudanella sp.]|nr:alpha-hydroxy-acid oxidizing protein [Rudanella sp.]
MSLRCAGTGIDWIQSFAKVPVLLKGILNPDDAEIAVQAGVSGIVVSNHSGRNLDTVPATIEALPRIAERVNKRVPILMDGGIRRGTDVLKAIALGANAVLVGKPICFGLACGGSADPTGNFVLVANQDSDNITIFKRDKTTGKLTPTGKEIIVSMPVCLLLTR